LDAIKRDPERDSEVTHVADLLPQALGNWSQPAGIPQEKGVVRRHGTAGQAGMLLEGNVLADGSLFEQHGCRPVCI
jgi:hypothetical protein